LGERKKSGTDLMPYSYLTRRPHLLPLHPLRGEREEVRGAEQPHATDVPDPKSYNRLNIIDILCFLIKYVATKIIDLI
jgi:hypothetical protein